MVFHHLSKRRTAMGLESPLPARRGSGMKKYQKSSCSAYSLYSKNS